MIKRGNRGGRPRIKDDIKQLAIKLYDEDHMTCKQIAKMCQISEASLYKLLRERRKGYNG